MTIRKAPLSLVEKAVRKAAKDLATQAERKLILAWCRKYDLPHPVFEYAFHDERKWRFDLAFVRQKVAVEIEGNIHHKGRHTTGTGFLADAEKYNTATAMGWRVFRVARPPQNAQWTAVLYHPQLVAWLQDTL